MFWKSRPGKNHPATVENSFKTTYKSSSESLLTAQKQLVECSAEVSPGLAELSNKVANARNRLEDIWQLRTSRNRSSNPQPPSTNVFMRYVNKARPSGKIQDSTDSDFIRAVKKAHTVSVEVSTTSTRREGYKEIFDLIHSHELPSKEQLSSLDARFTDILNSLDTVHVEYEVIIKEGSCLDSSKYQVSGPKLISLSQKTINFIIDAQNVKGPLKSFKNQLREVADSLHRHVLQVACDMLESPDDEKLHVEYIREIDDILDGLVDAFSNPTLLSTLASSFLSLRQTRESSLKTECSIQSHDSNRSLDISDTQDEIVFRVNNVEYRHKTSELTWEYVLETVLRPLEIPIIEVKDYERLENLSGGFASVDHVRMNGEEVALKRPIGSCENVLCVRFIREVYIWWKAGNHQNVNQLIGICRITPKDPPVMCSKWCNNEDLSKYLVKHHGGISRIRQINMALQVARALQHFRSCGIVHSDLKLNNVLLEKDQVKLHDFGISRISNDAKGLSTRSHGSYAYQAPEVIKTLFAGDSSHACATEESDIYCFGNILFECLTGLQPFPDLSNAAIFKAAVEEFKHPLSPEYGNKIEGAGSEELTRLLKDCWHRTPAVRPSADYIVSKLEEILESMTPASTDAAR